MRALRRLFVLPVLIGALTASAALASNGEGEEGVTSQTTNVVNISIVHTQELPAFSKIPKAPDSFWNKLSICETNSNWKDRGKWAGGLGIYSVGKFGDKTMGTWEHYGGEEFAPSPDKATKDEQIIIANRISTQGYKTIKYRDPEWAKIHGVPAKYVWEKKPAGFGGWGCYKSKSTGKYRMARPKLYHYEPKYFITAVYSLGQKGLLVKDLQTLLGITRDGVYGPVTRKAHLRFLRSRGLSISGVPPVANK